jgi:antitoxin PrlF
VTPALIRHSSGLRLPAAFDRDHFEFNGASEQIEVLNDRKLLVQLDRAGPAQDEAEDESLMLGLFLDFLTCEALSAAGGPVPYSAAMAAHDEELLAGVVVELDAEGR